MEEKLAVTPNSEKTTILKSLSVVVAVMLLKLR